MRAGTLQEVIEIYRSTITKNQYGEEVTEWNLIKTTRAKLDHTSQNTRGLTNDEVTYIYTKTLTVRFYIDIQEFDRIKWNNQYYRILDITPNKKLQQKEIKIELINE